MSDRALVVSTELPAATTSPSRARRYVEQVLADAGLVHLIDEALLLVTELVTNAVVHAGTTLELSVAVEGGQVRVEVLDRAPGAVPVVTAAPSETREGGRGIFLLDSLAAEWGTRHFGSGKSVWFLLGEGTDRPPRAAAGPDSSTRGRRDLSWLAGLPAALEERLSPMELLTELLHRLAEGLGLADVWLAAASAADDRSWELVAAHRADSAGPDLGEVRRLAGLGQVASQPGGGTVLTLRAGARVYGALVVAGPRLGADDLALARVVGERLGLILREERGQASERRARSSLALLAEASEMFAGTLDVTLALTLAAQLVVPRFAGWSAVYSTYERRPRLLAVAHSDEDQLGGLREAMSGNHARILVEAVAAQAMSLQPLPVLAADLPPGALLAGDGDALAVPLMARRRLVGLLVLGSPVTGRFSPDDVALLADLGRRAALAVDNARLYEERTTIAHALQASLLPAALPTPGALDFGARYVAAGEGNEVGGDFYDVFTLGPDSFGVAIGDVCGKGAEAAAITGMARDLLRLLTRHGGEPPAVLQRLNEAILDLGDRGRLCTATLCTVTPAGDDFHVRMSSAGHPPPALLTRSGQVSLVGRSGTVLGVVDDIDVADDTVVLTPGDALVFYTDGVTERRAGPLLFGEENVLVSLAGAAGCSAQVIAGRLEDDVRAFGKDVPRDDLAILVVRHAIPRERGSGTRR